MSDEEEDPYDGEEEYEEVSDDEKRRIATHFLLSSPPGEIKHMLEELKVIVPSSVLNGKFLSGVFRKYNLSQYLVMKRDDGSRVIIAPDNEVDDTRYYDAETANVVTVDHLSQSITASTGASREDINRFAPPEEEVLRRHLAVSLASYIKSQFAPDRKASASSTVLSQGGSTFTLLSSSVSVNIGAYWTGSWRSRYTVQISGSGGKAQLSGKVNVMAHYFEQGNVTMKDKKELAPISLALPEKGDDDWESQASDAIIGAIAAHDGEVQRALAAVYVSMDSKALKDMRRVTAVTGMKFDWTGKLQTVAKTLG